MQSVTNIFEISHSRAVRFNQSVQLRNKKRTDVWLMKRIGTSRGPPKVVALVPLSVMTDTTALLNSWLESEMVLATNSRPTDPVVYTTSTKHRCRFTVVRSASSNVLDIVDAVRVADIVVFVMNAPDVIDVPPTAPTSALLAAFQGMIDEYGQTALIALRSLGFPALMCAVNGLSTPPVDGMTSFNPTIQQNAKRLKEITRYLEYAISSDIRIADAVDSAGITRQLSEMTCNREISWRGNRSYVVADSVSIVSCGADVVSVPGEEDDLTVVMSGYIRGKPLFIHSLSHICGVGTSRIARIEVVPPAASPFAGGSRGLAIPSESSSSDRNVFMADPSKQDSLVMSATGDILAGEQTWPSEEEMGGVDEQGAMDNDLTVGRNRRRIAQAVG